MKNDRQEAPVLFLLAHETDDKKWVAEITGEDPVYKLQRSFLRESTENEYVLYDGYYQIYGIHPGITPFDKEYCRVSQGQMTRYLTYQQVLQALPEIIARSHERVERYQKLIITGLDEMAQQLDHELITEEIQYQKEEVLFNQDEQELKQAYDFFNSQRPKMIKQYQERLEFLRRDSFD